MSQQGSTPDTRMIDLQTAHQFVIRVVRLNQGSTNHGSRAKTGPRNHFMRSQRQFVNS